MSARASSRLSSVSEIHRALLALLCEIGVLYYGVVMADPPTGWTNDLARLPRVLRSELDQLAAASASTKKARRSYKLLTESYVVASSISACYDQQM